MLLDSRFLITNSSIARAIGSMRPAVMLLRRAMIFLEILVWLMLSLSRIFLFSSLFSSCSYLINAKNSELVMALLNCSTLERICSWLAALKLSMKA